jgi:ribonuclease-3
MLGFFPGNIEYYEEALLHKSLSRGSEARHLPNNERLEFLGDAVLDAIVADIVYHKFSNKDEGFLTNTRSKIVQRETLNQISVDLGLYKMIQTAAKTNTHKNHIYGNALEALIGAIYLDKGFKKTKKFIEKKIINAYMNIEKLAKKEVNFKSKLIEWSQKNKIILKFELVENFMDNDYNQVFQSRVVLGDIPLGIGIGYSKKESQQNAAKMAMKKLRAERGFIREIKHHQNEKEEDHRFQSYLKIDPESYLLNGKKPHLP